MRRGLLDVIKISDCEACDRCWWLLAIVFHWLQLPPAGILALKGAWPSMMRGARRSSCSCLYTRQPGWTPRVLGCSAGHSLYACMGAPATVGCAAADLYQNHERFEKTYFEPFKVSNHMHCLDCEGPSRVCTGSEW